MTSPGGVGLEFGWDGELATSSEMTGPVAGEASASYDDDLRIAELEVMGRTQSPTTTTTIRF